MRKLKKKWLSRALSCALAVTLTAGTAVMTPVADFVGTSITANAVTGVSSESALKNALANGGDIKLTANIGFTDSFDVSKNTNLDLNGYTISSSSCVGCFSINAAGITLTVKDSSKNSTGKIQLNSGGGTYPPGMFFFNVDAYLNIQSGNLIVNGGSGSAGRGCLVRSDSSSYGTVNISGGNITFSNEKISRNDPVKSITVTGGTFNKDVSSQVTLPANRSMALNANGRWELCRAKGDYWTAFDLPNNQIKVVLKGTLTGMSDYASTGAVKLDWNSILTAVGNYSITEISAEQGTQFVGSGYKMFNAQRTNWQSNKLDTVKKIDLSNVNTSQMTDMSYFFCYCTGLEELNISSFDTSNTTSMGSMFYHCHSLKSLDLTNFNTSKVTSVPYMFTECQSLESINLSSFDTSKFDALSAWFDGCKKLTVIDMSNFSTPLVEYTQQMFRNCISLTTVFVGSGWTVENATSHYDMFTNTTAIVGGQGTKYDINNPKDKTYARIDGGTDNPGYFTGKYTVTWKNENGTTLGTSEVADGTTPEYNGNTPAKNSDENYVYAFAGWTDGTNTYTENLPAVNGDVTYTAVYDRFAIIHEDDVFVNSTESTPEIVVTAPQTGAVLTAGTDYTIEIGESTVTVKGIGSYTGEVEKSFTVLSREMKASITNRRKAGSNAKATLSGEWYLPKNATNIKAGIARLSTDDTDVTNYDVYNNGVKKASALKTTSGKYSFSLLMNSTHANQNLYAVTYVTYEIDGVPFVSLSKAFTSYPNPV